MGVRANLAAFRGVGLPTCRGGYDACVQAEVVSPLQTPVASFPNTHLRELDQRQLDRRLADRVRLVARRSRRRQALRATRHDHRLPLFASAFGTQDIGVVAGRRGGARQADGYSRGEGRLEGRTLTFERAVLYLPTRERAPGEDLSVIEHDLILRAPVVEDAVAACVVQQRTRVRCLRSS